MLLLLIGGLITVSTGVTGLYIGRVFNEVRRRPLFVIDEEMEASVIGAEDDVRTEPVR